MSWSLPLLLLLAADAAFCSEALCRMRDEMTDGSIVSGIILLLLLLESSFVDDMSMASADAILVQYGKELVVV